MSELDLKISSGNSTVRLTQSEAIQQFKTISEYTHVKTIVKDLDQIGLIHVWLDSEYYTYNLKRVIVLPHITQDHCLTIHWPRVKCLNELVDSERQRVILNSIEKLIWDILKAIVGINLCGYTHNDVSIDNIAFHQGSFVLYDYNLSKRGSNLRKDLNSFKRSICFHLDQKVTSEINGLLQYLESLNPLDDFVYAIQNLHHFLSAQEAINYLDHLTIQ